MFDTLGKTTRQYFLGSIPNSLRRLFDPAALWIIDRQRNRTAGQHVGLSIDQDRLDVCRSGIQRKNGFHGF